MHVHVSCPEGEAKFWMKPIIALCEHHGLPSRKLRELQGIVEKRKDEIARAWKTHFLR